MRHKKRFMVAFRKLGWRGKISIMVSLIFLVPIAIFLIPFVLLVAASTWLYDNVFEEKR